MAPSTGSRTVETEKNAQLHTETKTIVEEQPEEFSKEEVRREEERPTEEAREEMREELEEEEIPIKEEQTLARVVEETQPVLVEVVSRTLIARDVLIHEIHDAIKVIVVRSLGKL